MYKATQAAGANAETQHTAGSEPHTADGNTENVTDAEFEEVK
jgi:hypothetical protein